MGISRTDLQSCCQLDPPRVLRLNEQGTSEPVIELDEAMFAHKVVIEAVLSNAFDVGMCRIHHFGRNQNRGLVESKRFTVPPRVYIANPGVDPLVADAFKHALCAFSRKEGLMLRRLFAAPLERFDAITDEDLNPIRVELQNEIRTFDGG